MEAGSKGSSPTKLCFMGGDTRAVMHVGIVYLWFPLKSMAGKTFPVHPRPSILHIW